MKKLSFILMSVFLFFHSMSQNGQLGIQLSPLTTIVSKSNVSYSSDVNLKPDLNISTYSNGYKIGINYNYMFKNNWALTPSFSYSMLQYAFKQKIFNNTSISSYTEKLKYGSFELSLIGNKYFKINDKLLFGVKLGVGYATNNLTSITTSSSVRGDTGYSSFSEISTTNWGSMRTFTPKIIAGISFSRITKNNRRLEFAYTFNYSFNQVSPYTMDRTINGKRYVATLSPILSSLNFEFTYYFKPFNCGKK